MQIKILSCLLFCFSSASYIQEIDENPALKYLEKDRNKVSLITIELHSQYF
jgi:hypothetical protein